MPQPTPAVSRRPISSPASALLLAAVLAACGTSDNSGDIDDVSGADADTSDGTGLPDTDADDDTVDPPDVPRPDAGDAEPDVDPPDAPEELEPDVNVDVDLDIPPDTDPDTIDDTNPDGTPDAEPDVPEDTDTTVEPDTEPDVDVLPFCTDDDDCEADEVCDDTGRCQLAPCANGVLDGDETDIDCGGADCAPCPVDSVCLADEDCDTERCAIDDGEALGRCVACEADSDCGGTDWCDTEAGRCEPTPCSATSCNAAPRPACDGDTAISYQAVGVCSSPGGVLRCAYDIASTTDCAARGFPCADGVCQDPCAGRELCEIAGTACVGDVRVACARDADGCLVRTATDCALRDGTCTFRSGVAQCVDICSTRVTCSEGPPGTRCEGNSSLTCALDADGCLIETSREFCGTSTCDATAGCVSPCEAASSRPLTCGATYSSNTVGGTRVFTSFSCDGGTGAPFQYGGPEAIMELRLPESQAVTLNVNWPSDVDYDFTVLRAVDGVCDPSLPCVASSAIVAVGNETVTFLAEADTTYYGVLTVFGASGGAATAFTVQTLCETFICGDGVVTGLETCDDGNELSRDGCSATCNIEAGYSCSGTPSVCTLAPDSCDTRGTLAFPLPNQTVRAQGNTTTSTDRFRAGCGGGATSADHVYELVVPETARLLLETTAATNFDTVLHVRSGATCIEGTAGDVACNDDVSSGVLRSRIDQVFRPGTYQVIVDGFGSSRGSYVLEVTHLPGAGAP